MKPETLRVLERRHAESPEDLGALRALADERKRRGLEWLPGKRRFDSWHWIFEARTWLVAWARRGARFELTVNGERIEVAILNPGWD